MTSGSESFRIEHLLVAGNQPRRAVIKKSPLINRG
jgi:hypothetical protein